MILKHYYPPKAAVCGMHVSSEVWDDDYGTMPIDERDAEKIEKLIKKLPIHLCKAVRYHYTGRPKVIGIPHRLITELVEQAAREVMSIKFHVLVDKP